MPSTQLFHYITSWYGHWGSIMLTIMSINVWNFKKHINHWIHDSVKKKLWNILNNQNKSFNQQLYLKPSLMLRKIQCGCVTIMLLVYWIAFNTIKQATRSLYAHTYFTHYRQGKIYVTSIHVFIYIAYSSNHA